MPPPITHRELKHPKKQKLTKLIIDFPHKVYNIKIEKQISILFLQESN